MANRHWQASCPWHPVRALPLAWIICIAGLTLFAAMQQRAGAQSRLIDREHSIKAAFLYNFGRYTEWPKTRTNQPTFVIGVVGKTPLKKTLVAIAKKRKLCDKQIIIRDVSDETGLRSCSIVFFAARLNESLVGPMLKRAQSLPILTVGETPGFARAGGIMNFYIEENKIRFEINTGAADRAGLKISANLLRLGKLVQERSGVSGTGR